MCSLSLCWCLLFCRLWFWLELLVVHLEEVNRLRRVFACHVMESSRRNIVRLALSHKTIVVEKVLFL